MGGYNGELIVEITETYSNGPILAKGDAIMSNIVVVEGIHLHFNKENQNYDIIFSYEDSEEAEEPWAIFIAHNNDIKKEFINEYEKLKVSSEGKKLEA